jgi:hypothetical protein
MATATVEELTELLAQAYEILKRHEQAVYDLTIDVETLKAKLSDSDRAVFDSARQRARSESGFGFDRQARSYDGTIRQLRGK